MHIIWLQMNFIKENKNKVQANERMRREDEEKRTKEKIVESAIEENKNNRDNRTQTHTVTYMQHANTDASATTKNLTKIDEEEEKKNSQYHSVVVAHHTAQQLSIFNR